MRYSATYRKRRKLKLSLQHPGINAIISENLSENWHDMSKNVFAHTRNLSEDSILAYI